MPRAPPDPVLRGERACGYRRSFASVRGTKGTRTPMTVKRKLAERAHDFVDLVHEEVSVPGQWQTDEVQSG